jgi:hypothetical protein
LVFLEMSAHKSELRAEFARSPTWHPSADPEGPGFVRSGKHDATTDRDGLPRNEGSSSCSTEA